MNDKTKGFILGAIAAITYGLNPLFALPLYSSGMNPDSVLFFRYLFAIPILAIMLKSRGRNIKIKRDECFSLIVMGLLMALSSLTLFESYNYLGAGIASTLLFIYPIMVAVIMTLFFKEKLRLQTVICIFLAMAGIWLLYKNSNGDTLNLTGVILVVVSALSYAIYLVGVNHSKLKNVATLTLTFYVIIFGLSLYAGRLLTVTPLTLPGKWFLWGNLLALAIFPTAISLFCTTAAIKYIGSTPTAILGALEPVTAIVIGIIIFNETLTPRDWVGLSLIIIAVTFVVTAGKITAPLLRFRKMFPKLPQKGKKQ